MAGSYARWLCDQAQVGIINLKTAVLAGKDIIDQITDFFDAFPVVGPIVNNVADLVLDMATRGDYDDLAGLVNDQYAREYVQCFAYCWMKTNVPQGASITFEQCGQMGDALQADLFVQPPRGPLLSLWGQFLSIFAGAADARVTAFRLAIAADERSDDCSILCSDCPDGPEPCSEVISEFLMRYGGTFEVDPVDPCLVHFTSGGAQGDGDYYVALETVQSADFSLQTSNPSGLSLVNCRWTIDMGAAHFTNIGGLEAVSAMDNFYIRSNTPFTIDITFTPA